MSTTKKTSLSVLVVALVGGLVAFGTYAAFFSQTTSDANTFSTGTVVINDNDSGAALYSVSNAKPGQSSTAKCITVTYSGSLNSTVKLYRSAFTGGTGLDTDIDLVVTRGSGGAFADCSGFTAAATGSSVYSGKLNAFPATYAGGLSLQNAGGSTTWATNDAVTYKVQATLPSDANDNSRQNKSTGTHSFTWEAQNQ